MWTNFALVFFLSIIKRLLQPNADMSSKTDQLVGGNNQKVRCFLLDLIGGVTYCLVNFNLRIAKFSVWGCLLATLQQISQEERIQEQARITFNYKKNLGYAQ